MDEKHAEATSLIHLLGLGCGLGETAEELRNGGDVSEAADYIEKVGDLLWAYVGNPDRRADER